MASTLFITGTGTDVGKTALSLAVLFWARDRGLRAAYLKPVQCGISVFGEPPARGGDAEWIQALSGGGVAAHVTYPLRLPASPHLAAERENVVLDLTRIRTDADALAKGRDLLLMEGAGGPAVPLDRIGVTLADLAAEACFPCLIACAPGLGTLHHTLSTLAYLQSKRVGVAGFVFCHREAAASELAGDNIETLRALSGLPFFGELAFHGKLARGVAMARAEADAWVAPLNPSLDAWWAGERK